MTTLELLLHLQAELSERRQSRPIALSALQRELERHIKLEQDLASGAVLAQSLVACGE